jgi:formylglycine-generating enzyme required for sulfatase activity
LILAISIATLCVVGMLMAFWLSKPPPEKALPPAPPKIPESLAGPSGLQVSLLLPARPGRLISPAVLQLEAAIKTTKGTVQWVEFQTNKVPLVRLTVPPYKFNWSAMPVGTYEISAVAIDDFGTTTSSAPVAVVVCSLLPLHGMAWTNSLGMEFLPLPEGGGWLCRHETRLADYVAFKSNHVAQNMRLSSFSQHSDREPVVKVSWLNAGKFCQWLTEREQKMGRLGVQHRYRLPQVNEWRQALRTGIPTKSGFPWGANWPPPPRTGNLRGGEWVRSGAFGVEPLPAYEDGVRYTAPVGTFNPNSNGFYDLIGNVWELCEKRGKNGRMNAVALGGAWSTDNPDELRSSFELPISSESLDRDDLGFRCLLVEEGTNKPSASSFQRNSK